MLLSQFKKSQLCFFLNGRKRFFPYIKAVCLPIMKENFFQVTRNKPTDGNKLNINAAFKTIWVGIMRIGKMIFTVVQNAALLFKDIQVTSVNIHFFKFDQFVTLRLSTSKSVVNFTRILRVIGLTHEQNCPLITLRKLFFQDSKAADMPNFIKTKKTFIRKYLNNIMNPDWLNLRLTQRILWATASNEEQHHTRRIVKRSTKSFRSQNSRQVTTFNFTSLVVQKLISLLYQLQDRSTTRFFKSYQNFIISARCQQTSEGLTAYKHRYLSHILHASSDYTRNRTQNNNITASLLRSHSIIDGLSVFVSTNYP